MPEPLIHFVIPFVSFTLARARYRKALFVSILALTPDLDVLFLVHKSQSHSIILLTAIVLPTYLLLRRKGYSTYVLLASLGLASHIVLDLFNWYTPVIWPIWDQSIRLLVELNVHIASEPAISFTTQILTQPTIMTFKTMDEPLFTSDGLIVSTILLLPILYTLVRSRLT